MAARRQELPYHFFSRRTAAGPGPRGRLRHEHPGARDRDLWLRVAEVAPIAYLNRPLTGYRIVSGSVSQQVQACQAGMLHPAEARRTPGLARPMAGTPQSPQLHFPCMQLSAFDRTIPNGGHLAEVSRLVPHPFPPRRVDALRAAAARGRHPPPHAPDQAAGTDAGRGTRGWLTGCPGGDEHR